MIRRTIYFTILMLGAGAAARAGEASFPPPLSSYQSAPGSSLWDVLSARAAQEPFNVVATVIFLLAILHTFLAPYFTRLAHRVEQEHQRRIELEGRTAEAKPHLNAKDDVSFKAQFFHFLGEVEAIFGIWVIPLLIAWTAFKGGPEPGNISIAAWIIRSRSLWW